MGAFKDHFSGHAALYHEHRPRYADSLFTWLAEPCPSRGCAWDGQLLPSTQQTR